MTYFVNNTIQVGSVIGLIAVLLLATAFIVGSIVHDFRQRNFGLAFMQIFVAIIGFIIMLQCGLSNLP